MDKRSAPTLRGFPERNDYPAPVDVDGVTYPTVAHAYWALSATDPDARAAIACAETSAAACGLAAGATRRDDWEHARVSAMTGLLRAKYTQHPYLAEVLLTTADATLIYSDANSGFWGDNAGRGRNWTGRLLELIRSELHAQRAGIV